MQFLCRITTYQTCRKEKLHKNLYEPNDSIAIKLSLRRTLIRSAHYSTFKHRNIMQTLFYFSVASLLIPFPFMAGYIAKSLGRSYWFWFLLSLILPWIACFILVCLPDKSSDELSEFENQ